MEWLTVMVVLTSMNVRAIRRCVMRTLCVTTQKGRMPAFANPDSMVMELFVKTSLSVTADPATLMLNVVSCKEVSCVPATLVGEHSFTHHNSGSARGVHPVAGIFLLMRLLHYVCLKP